MRKIKFLMFSVLCLVVVSACVANWPEQVASAPGETGSADVVEDFQNEVTVTKVVTVNAITGQQTAILNHPNPFSINYTGDLTPGSTWIQTQYQNGLEMLRDEGRGNVRPEVLYRHFVVLEDGSVAELYSENLTTVLALGAAPVRIIAEIFGLGLPAEETGESQAIVGTRNVMYVYNWFEHEARGPEASDFDLVEAILDSSVDHSLPEMVNEFGEWTLLFGEVSQAEDSIVLGSDLESKEYSFRVGYDRYERTIDITDGRAFMRGEDGLVELIPHCQVITVAENLPLNGEIVTTGNAVWSADQDVLCETANGEFVPMAYIASFLLLSNTQIETSGVATTAFEMLSQDGVILMYGGYDTPTSPVEFSIAGEPEMVPTTSFDAGWFGFPFLPVWQSGDVQISAYPLEGQIQLIIESE